MKYPVIFHIVESDANGCDNGNDGFGIIDIGHLVAPKGVSEKKAESIIRKAWHSFQETCPNSDDEFAEYLSDKHRFKKVQNIARGPRVVISL